MEKNKVFDVGPGELKASSGRHVVLRCPVLGSCVALFVYDAKRRAAALAHIMLPAFGPSGSSQNADVAVRGLVSKPHMHEDLVKEIQKFLK